MGKIIKLILLFLIFNSAGVIGYAATSPTVTISAPSPRFTNTGPVDFTVIYSQECNISLAPEDIILTKTGNANGIVTVSGTDSTRRIVTISNITGDGSIAISLKGGTATDFAGNLFPAAGPSQTIIVDNTAPVITVSEPSKYYTNGGYVTYTLEFSGYSSFVNSNLITLVKTGTANGNLVRSNVVNNKMTVNISSLYGNGTLGLYLNQGVISDSFGNPSRAMYSNLFTVDQVPPDLVELKSLNTDLLVHKSENVIIQATFNEPVNSPSINIDMINASDDIVLAPMSGSGAVWSYTWQVPDGNEGRAVVSVAAKDRAGNNYTGTKKLEFNIDNVQYTPSMPTDLVAYKVLSDKVFLSWNAANDNTSVANYKVYRDNKLLQIIDATDKPQFVDANLMPSKNYEYKVVAVDRSENESLASEAINISTLRENQEQHLVPTSGADILAFDTVGLDFESYAFTDNTRVTITKLATKDFKPTPKGLKFMGNVYDLNSETSFEKPVTITFRYSNQDIEDLFEDTLAIYYFNQNTRQWEKIGGTLDLENQTLTVNLEHFSQYAVLGEINTKYYMPTPRNVVYGSSKFNPDGKTNYPYEIYLPNETNPENYRIHSNYTKNTDACASCHATHTAVGASLLQWYSVYETCMACHDGTVTTTYNVEAGQTPSGKPTFGGMFGNGKEEHLSSHNVKGSVEIGAAPGGTALAESLTDDYGKQTIRWAKSFGCESCHSPHGQGGNARILSPDPNGFASRMLKDIFEVKPVNIGDNNYIVFDEKGNRKTLIKGYPYKIQLLDVNKIPIADAENKYIITNTGDATYGSYTTVTAKTSYSITDVAYVRGTASLKVRMQVDNYLQESEKVTHISGLNAFCGACHVDYNTEYNAAEENGEYSKAHRHSVGVAWNYGNAADADYIGSNKLLMTMGENEPNQYITCLTCHFAHGTSKTMWESWLKQYELFTEDASNKNLWTDNELTELAGSSALKRLPNMGTCEACHQKAAANEGYAVNSGTTTSGNATATNGVFSNIGAEYIGITVGQCSSCHPQQYREWAQSKHKQFLQAGNIGIVRMALDNWADGPGNAISNVVYTDVVYTIGNTKYQAYVVEENGELRVLPYQWRANEQKWSVDYPLEAGQKISYTDRCIGCHTTGYNPENSTYVDNGITCEACHGPAGNHAKYSWSDKNIVTPQTLSPQYQNDLCGQCHAYGKNRVFNGRQDAVGYIPGEGNKLSTVFEVYTKDTDPKDNFWPDGSAKGKYMEYNDLTGVNEAGEHNKHYASGITCFTCHSAHGTNNEGKMLKTPGFTICKTCHDIGADVQMRNFVNSNMPFTAQFVPDIFELRSHRQ